MRYKFPIQGKWTEFSDSDLNALGKETSDLYKSLYEEYKSNPLAMFAPHGVPRCSRPRSVAGGKFTLPKSIYSGHSNDGVAFLSDTTSDGSMMVGPNQQGKTVLLAIWTALRILKCDPSWDIFKFSKVKHIPFNGPKTWIVSSYSWDNVSTLWQRIREFFPSSELGLYARGGRKNLSFGDGRPKSIEMAESGSTIRFLCYTQQQFHWESFDSDGASFDEQVPRDKFIGWRRSITTKGDDTQFAISLTGHVLSDRPDTGMAGWLYKDLYCDENRMGMLVHLYHLSVESTPIQIVSKKKKRDLHLQWVAKTTPEGKPIERSKHDERAAVARYWGGWEQGSGAVFGGDVWQRDIHVINPLWEDNNIPNDVTKFRVIDYGSAKGINCCAWFAVCKEGYAVLYRLIYERDLEIADFVPKIISMSHNKRDFLHETKDHRTGNTYEYYVEQQCRETFWYTVLDSRSCSQSQQGATLEGIFSRYGLSVTPGCGQTDAVQIPKLKDWLRIDFCKTNPFSQEKGMPRLFFFDTPNCVSAVREIEGARLPARPSDLGYIDKRDPQHFIDTAKMWASLDPVYRGDSGVIVEESGYSENNTPYTAY